MFQKRGQLSIFLILAIVILLLGAFYFYTDNAAKREVSLENPQAAAAKNFIETCIQGLSDRAFRIIGINGGYITFPDEINNDPRTYLQMGPVVDTVKNPYWWYDGKENVPTEEFMVNQAEVYIQENLDTCIEQLSARQNFKVKKLDDMHVEINLNYEDITVDVDYPLQLEFGENKSRVKFREFKIITPIRFKKMYEFAKDIMKRENENFFLERKTIDLITLDNDIPTTDIEVSCKEKVWFVSEVEKKLKRLLNANLPYVNIVGTDFNTNTYVPNPFGNDVYRDSYFNTHYIWKVSDNIYDDIDAAINYDTSWPMKLYVRPSKNGVMRSKAQRSQDLLQFLCLHIWHFTYDVVYPVRITLTDNKGVDPYQFNFAFTVSVDHNAPKREKIAFRLLEGLDETNQEEYCEDRVNEISLYTIEDTIEQHDVVDVNLSFTCGVYHCDLGQTEWLGFGAAAGITQKLPWCNNAILRAKKEGYEDSQMLIQTEEAGVFTMALRPIKEFMEYEVVKHDFDDPLLEQKLDEDESVSISIKSTDKEKPFEAFAVYPSAGGIPVKLLNDDQTYQITLFLSDGDSITGGYETTWTVTRDELADKERIKFRVLEHTGNEDERFLFVQGLQSYSSKIPAPQII